MSHGGRAKNGDAQEREGHSARAWVLAHLGPDPDREQSINEPALALTPGAVAARGAQVGRTAALVAAMIVLLGAGVSRRRLTDDAGVARALADAVSRVPSMLPKGVGTWTGTEVDVDRRGLDGAGIVALAARRYTDAATGEAVTAVLLCGRPGPIAAHGPESCYPGVGFTAAGAPQRLSVPSLGLALWSATFQGGPTSAQQDLIVSWAWADRSGWSTPDNPRLRFAPAPRLYKIYLLYEPGPAPPSGADFPPLRLAAELLPQLDVVTESSR